MTVQGKERLWGHATGYSWPVCVMTEVCGGFSTEII